MHMVATVLVLMALAVPVVWFVVPHLMPPGCR